MNGRTAYGSFLRLDLLLDLQPSGAGEATGVALEKHFFVVIHQAFELWFKQMIHDIDGAIADLAHGGDAVTKLRRVAAVETLLVQQMQLLSHLDPAAFSAFRGELGTASAAQSSQFHEIQQRLGLLRDDDPGPLWGALSRCEKPGEMRSGASDVVSEITETWLRLWATHVSLVESFIGDRAGTGGTSGVAYLKCKLADLSVRAAHA